MEEDIELEVQVTEVLHRLGVPVRLNGYRYLREAIIMLIGDMGIARSITKVLYHDVAKLHNSSPERVERAIRTAVGLSWKNGGIKEFEEIFGYSREENGRKPCNSEYMVQIADKIRMDRSYHSRVG